MIAVKTGLDANKLERILRVLTTDFIFKEVTPSVFANNRNSSFLDTGKTYEEIQLESALLVPILQSYSLTILVGQRINS